MTRNGLPLPSRQARNGRPEARHSSAEPPCGCSAGAASRSRPGAGSYPIVPVTVTGPVKVSPSGGLWPTLTGPPLGRATVGYASRGVVTTVLRREPPLEGKVRVDKPTISATVWACGRSIRGGAWLVGP
jgi:1-acyl-sn-glycerol-3-phosphate acyltransferase